MSCAAITPSSVPRLPKSAMNFRVQRFNAAVHHFGKPVVRDLVTSTPSSKQTTGPTCREDFDTAMGKGLREFNDAGFIGDTDQGAPQRRSPASFIFIASFYRVSVLQRRALRSPRFRLGFGSSKPCCLFRRVPGLIPTLQRRDSGCSACTPSPP